MNLGYALDLNAQTRKSAQYFNMLDVAGNNRPQGIWSSVRIIPHSYPVIIKGIEDYPFVPPFKRILKRWRWTAIQKWRSDSIDWLIFSPNSHHVHDYYTKSQKEIKDFKEIEEGKTN